MTALEVFEQIDNRQIQALMFHTQMADYFDFLGLNGFKRMHEYRFLKECAENRGVHRYVLNHINKLLKDNGVANPKAIPVNWYNYSRLDVDASTRKNSVRDAFIKWHEWETQTKSFLEKKFKELTENGNIACANKVNELICNSDQELKIITRKVLKYKSIDWDMTYIEMEQDELHEHYKNKTKEIGVNIC